MIRDAAITRSGSVGVDAPISVEGDVLAVGPAAVRVGSDVEWLPRHELVLVADSEARVLSVELVREGADLRVAVREELEDVADEGAGRFASLATLATVWLPAGGVKPARLVRCVLTPAPPPDAQGSEHQGGSAAVLWRPASAKARERLSLEREIAALRAEPLSADRLSDEQVRALLLLLARRQGLVR